IPLLSEQFLTSADAEHEESPAPRGVLGRAGAAIDAISERYARALSGVLHHRTVMVVAAVALVGAGGLADKAAGTGFLRDMDEGAFVLDYWTPGGTALAETDRQLHIVEQILAETPEIEGTSRRTGAEMGMFATEQNTGDIAVRLKARSQRDRG